MAVDQMSPQELAMLREAGSAPVILDVRESGELALVDLGGVVHIPMSEIGQRAAHELDPDTPLVVMCHHGVRSMVVAQWLANELDFATVWNLAGGIDRYALDVDPSVGRY